MSRREGIPVFSPCIVCGRRGSNRARGDARLPRCSDHDWVPDDRVAEADGALAATWALVGMFEGLEPWETPYRLVYFRFHQEVHDDLETLEEAERLGTAIVDNDDGYPDRVELRGVVVSTYELGGWRRS